MKHPGLIVAVVVVAVVLVGFIYMTTDIIEGLLGKSPTGFSATLGGQKTNLTVNYTATVVGGYAPFGYIWDFGDGVSRITSTPSVVYTYAVAGTYTATVLVRDNTDTLVEASFTVTVTAG